MLIQHAMIMSPFPHFKELQSNFKDCNFKDKSNTLGVASLSNFSKDKPIQGNYLFGILRINCHNFTVQNKKQQNNTFKGPELLSV